jgi:hypothetical protein
MFAVGAVIGAYLVGKGSLEDAFTGTIVFNVEYLDRQREPFWEHCRRIYTVTREFSQIWFPVVIVGMAGHLALYRARRRQWSSWLEVLREDPAAPLLLTFPAPCVWSFADFQGHADVFVFMVHAAVGFAYVCWLVTRRLRKKPVALAVAFAIGCLIEPFIYRHDDRTLADQNLALADFMRVARSWKYGDPDATGAVKVDTIGCPECLVLLHQVASHRFTFIVNGVDNYIEAGEPDGVQGWLDRIGQARPDVLVTGVTWGPHESDINGWLDQHYRLTMTSKKYQWFFHLPGREDDRWAPP